MSRSVFWALVRKDVYLMRGFIIATLVTGLLTLVLSMLGRTGFAVGGVLFLTASIGSGIFIAMYTMMTERKDQSHVFALSLPVSGVAYRRAKLVGACLTYGVTWVVLTLLAVSLFLVAPEAPRGMVIYALLIQGFALAMFCVVIAALFVSTSETMSGVVILVVNVSFSLFMIALNQPHNARPLRTTDIVVTPFAGGTLIAEVLVIALSIGTALYFIGQRRDHL